MTTGTGRLIAIGDVHGCSTALRSLLDLIQPADGDVVVALGDYVDRGPDSKGVVDAFLGLEGRCRLVALRGNHESLMLAALADPAGAEIEAWRSFGGEETLESYEGSLDAVPCAHRTFLKDLRLFYETDSFLFMHASYLPDLPMLQQPEYQLLWTGLRDYAPGPHVSGKTAVVGHTSQKNGEILDLGHLVCIDTFCHGGGWLTAYNPETGDVWQARQTGETRFRPRAFSPAVSGPSDR